jgi:thiamine-phosphate pyrophosphorylase
MNGAVSRMSLAHRLALMAITDPAATIGVVDATRAALAGGATSIQIRWKHATARELVELVRALRQVASDAGALLIVNDRVDVALAADADGAHLGNDDLPLRAARSIAPPGFLLGRSVDTPAEAATAEREGADYVGFGPIFPTPSKADTGPVVGPAGIAAVRAATGLPIVAIGGIGPGRAGEVVRAGADGIAVLGAIMMSREPERVTRELLQEISGARGSA